MLGHALDTVLRLLHPVVPFVTEALWTALTGGESLVVASWPRTRAGPKTVWLLGTGAGALHTPPLSVRKSRLRSPSIPVEVSAPATAA